MCLRALWILLGVFVGDFGVWDLVAFLSYCCVVLDCVFGFYGFWVLSGIRVCTFC